MKPEPIIIGVSAVLATAIYALLKDEMIALSQAIGLADRLHPCIAWALAGAILVRLFLLSCGPVLWSLLLQKLSGRNGRDCE
jgi:hypothetical protein